MIVRPGLEQIDGSGAARGQVPVWDPDTQTYKPGSVGTVQTVTAGTNVTVDSTDPAHLVINGAELLMQDGVTSPPVPIETEAGDDWLYRD